MKNIYTVRDLISWLEYSPKEFRKRCLCLLQEGEEVHYLNLSAQDVEAVYKVEIEGEDQVHLTIDPGYSEQETLGLETTLTPESSINEIVVVDPYGYKMTVEDILRKLYCLDYDLPLFYGIMDLKASTGEHGAVFITDDQKKETLEQLEKGIHAWNDSQADKMIWEEELIKEIPSKIEEAFVIKVNK